MSQLFRCIIMFIVAVFGDQTHDLRMFSGDINQSTGRGRGISQLTADEVHDVLYGPKAALEGSEQTARIVPEVSPPYHPDPQS